MVKKKLIPLILLFFVPIALIADYWHGDKATIFFTSAIAIIPLSIWLATATEKIAVVTGPSIGGFVNAIFANATGLIIALTALRQGLAELVEATITGGILGSLLLSLGLAMLAGGLKYKEQSFKRIVVEVSGSSMTLALTALALPTIIVATSPITDAAEVRNLSLIVSTILLIVYGLTLLFSLKTHSYLYNVGLADAGTSEEKPNLWLWVGVLLASTVGLAVISDPFVEVIQTEIKDWGLTPLFTGVILLPILSEVAALITVIRMALNDKMDLILSTVTGGALLDALFFGPFLVVVGQLFGQLVDLNFHPLEVISIAIAVTLANLIGFSERSTWLDGILLVASYLVLAVAFYYHPA
jgi:Ca2+:H+ antiporter